MAGVTQTIDSYYAGVSQQPDLKKFPGQLKGITNGIPDPIEGLYKRPGAQRIGTTPLANVQPNGSWFHYYRDETEGSYIGQIASDGRVRVWSCIDGTQKNVWYNDTDNGSINNYTNYSTDNSNAYHADHTSITSYLTPSTVDSVVQTEDIQALTINDTTFLNNRSKTVATTNTLTDGTPHTDFAYIDLLRTENGRQYGLNIFDGPGTTDFKTATRLSIDSDTVHSANTHGTGHCPAIGTEVFNISGSDYAMATDGQATFTTAGTAGIDNQRVTVNRNDHGFKTGDQVRIEATENTLSSFQDQSGAVITRVNDNQFYYDTGSNQGDHDGNNHTVNIRTAHKDKGNLVFRLTTKGQQSSYISGDGGADDANDFSCVYTKEVSLLYGGEGWGVGDQVVVRMEGYDYVIKVKTAETTAIKKTIGGADDGDIRPTCTPFDADTAVTASSILGGIQSKIAALSGSVTIGTKVIGNGIYLHADSNFNLEVIDKDLMRIMQSEVNDVSELPNQCKHGYIVKVANSRESNQDDYYLKFKGENDLDGPGSWIECPAPKIKKSLDATTMPHVLQRQENGDFLVKKYTWEDRLVGDDTTNDLPSFVGKKINRVLFFRNRLAILSGENVVLSRPGELGTPSFFAKTALAVSAVDPIDISCSSTFSSELYDGIETTSGLLVFSNNQQFLLSSDAEILNPDTAKLRSVATYNYNKDISPISLGVTVGYVDNSGKNSRFNEMADIKREGEPIVIETSKIVPTFLPKNIDLLTNSRENGLVLLGKTNSEFIYCYRYIQSGTERSQASWFKWKLNKPIKYHFIIDDTYYLLDTNDFLQKISIMQKEDDPSIDQDNVNYLIHLDNWTKVSGGSYNTSSNITTFANQSDWIDQVTSPNGKLVVVDTDPNVTRVGRYAECTITNTDDFTIPGDWSREITSITVSNGGSGYTSAPSVTISGGGGTGATATATISDGAVTAVTITNNGYNFTSAPTVSFSGGGGSSAAATAAIHGGEYYIGYLYEYNIEFPHFYMSKTEGQRSISDVSSSLVLHRLKLNLGKTGLYSTTLKRLGKADYTEIYESTTLDEYNVSDAPYVPDQIQTVPVYENTKNVDVFLKSTHPAPATLYAVSWEGDYSTRNYRRV